MDIPISVDRNAPVLAHHEIDISAQLSRVWALHQDVDAWPTWQSHITAAQDQLGLDCDVHGVRGAGPVPGVVGRHRRWHHRRARMVFTATPTGTHVATTESFAGAPVEADVAGMQRVLDGSLVSWLNHLKNAAEAAE